MRSVARGPTTSGPEVTHVSSRGIWILVDDRERFLPYAQFPWFKNAVVRDVLRVERVGRDHLRWRELDVDLSIQSIEDPEPSPLVSNARLQRKRATARR